MSNSGFNTSFGTGQFVNMGSSLSSERKGQLEYKKIFCAYHSTQFLTNFCTDKQCLMPLCPTCVVEHTEEHYQRGQKPAYVNLHDALHESRQYCYGSIVKLQEFDRRNMELSSYIQGLPDYIRKQLEECKQKLFHMIEQKFAQYETKLIEQIRGKYAQEGVYSRKECEQVRQFITAQIQSLYEKITQLKGDQCLASLIRYYQNDEKTLEAEMKEVGQYIQKNRKAGGLYISLNMEEVTRELEGICEKIVEHEYVQQDEGRSYSSSKNLEGTSGIKKGISNSVVKRIGNSGIKGSGVKGSGVKSSAKQRVGNQSYSSHKNMDKGAYQSPFHNNQEF